MVELEVYFVVWKEGMSAGLGPPCAAGQWREADGLGLSGQPLTLIGITVED